MIDTHHHLWSLSRPECSWPTPAEGPIHRDFGPGDFAHEAEVLGIERAVLVQSQENGPDTDWLLEIAEASPVDAAIVGWVDVEDPASAGRIAALAAHPIVAGLRPMVQHREADWYDRPAALRGIRIMAEQGLRLDALVKTQHLASLHRLASSLPDLSIVIDHAAKPRIGAEDGYASWYEAIAPLADRPNIWCKLSGLLTESPENMRNEEGIGPYVKALLALFGQERLMWGSDWPVVQASGGIAEWVRLCRNLVPSEAQTDVFRGTAIRFYALGEDMKG